MGDTRNVVVIPWRERAGGGGELTSRNVAARIGSKVETRVRLDCHPESILITATSQPLFLRRCTTGLFLLDREREREEFASLELKSMALRAVNFARPGEDPNKHTHSPLCPPWNRGIAFERLRSKHEEEGREKISRRRLKKTRPSSIFLDSFGNRHRGHRSIPLPLLPPPVQDAGRSAVH